MIKRKLLNQADRLYTNLMRRQRHAPFTDERLSAVIVHANARVIRRESAFDHTETMKGFSRVCCTNPYRCNCVAS